MKLIALTDMETCDWRSTDKTISENEKFEVLNVYIKGDGISVMKLSSLDNNMLRKDCTVPISYLPFFKQIID